MPKNSLSLFIIKSIKKLVEKLYFAGVFNILQTKKSNLEAVNVTVGEHCSIDSSAILTTIAAGKIIFNGYNYIGRNVEIGTDAVIKFGFNTSIQDRCILLGEIEIGNFCVFAPNIYISSGRHNYDHIPEFYIKDQDEIVLKDEVLRKKHSKKVIIEDDCWIGINSVLMAGVKIGRGSVIGANAVVTKNVEPFSVVAGAPAKTIKKRLDFLPKTILSYNNNKDLPNFYKGFFVDLNSLETDRKDNGISACGSFTFYLSKGNKMKLLIKKAVAGPLSLKYNTQTRNINNDEFNEIIFDMVNEHYHHFVIEPIDKYANKKYLLVKEVEVLSQ